MRNAGKNTAILLCAGSGQRMAGAADKILGEINGRPVLLYSLDTFIASSAIDTFIVVYRDETQKKAIEAHLGKYTLTVAWVQGGKRRQDSVFAALAEAKKIGSNLVLIHDCARPMLRSKHVLALISAAEKYSASVLAHRVVDTVKQVDGSVESVQHLKNVDRSCLWAMETPQAFLIDVIYRAYQHVFSNGIEISDDTAACESIGQMVKIVENDELNVKLTYPSDIPLLSFLLSR